MQSCHLSIKKILSPLPKILFSYIIIIIIIISLTKNYKTTQKSGSSRRSYLVPDLNVDGFKISICNILIVCI